MHLITIFDLIFMHEIIHGILYKIKKNDERHIRAIPTYRVSSVPGKHSWVLKHNSLFWPTWVLTQDQNSVHLYRSCYSGPLKCGTRALTREWALAQYSTVYARNLSIVHIIFILTA